MICRVHVTATGRQIASWKTALELSSDFTLGHMRMFPSVPELLKLGHLFVPRQDSGAWGLASMLNCMSRRRENMVGMNMVLAESLN